MADPRPPPNPSISTSPRSTPAGCGSLIIPCTMVSTCWSILLTDENVEVLCVQEVFAGDFPSLPQTNLSHMMVPPVLAGAKRVSCSEVVCQDSPFLESRMHCPCAGEWLTTQCASVRSMRPMQVCLRVSELHFGRSCSRVRGMCVPRLTFQ